MPTSAGLEQSLEALLGASLVFARIDKIDARRVRAEPVRALARESPQPEVGGTERASG